MSIKPARQRTSVHALIVALESFEQPGLSFTDPTNSPALDGWEFARWLIRDCGVLAKNVVVLVSSPVGRAELFRELGEVKLKQGPATGETLSEALALVEQ